jgi:DNA primase
LTTAFRDARGARTITASSGIVAEIKSKLPVADVVGETVVLKRAGTILKGLCPFHSEKTPSFIVTPERETWHCFGCGEHGDIFTFAMRRDGLEFREALARLAERAGVELNARTAGEDRRKRRLREALEAAIAWYREVLLQANQAERARDYLAERGFSAETLERFGIGYALNTWEAMSRRLRAKGFTDAELTDAGLASPSTRGGVYDRFRGRIIIPIRDASGRAIGLGGRILPGAEGPKYLNSPATALFDKSRTLYAIDLAKGAIRREKLAVIVEGYTDVMAAHQAGFENVVASLGTALTAGQVELANRYADAVALAYDVDLAGEAATQRGLLEELGPEVVNKVRVVRVPEGKDPDELIRTNPDAWRAAVAEAQQKNRVLMDYFIERETTDIGDSIAERMGAAQRVLSRVAGMPASLLQGTTVLALATRLSLNEQDLREELQRQQARSSRLGRAPHPVPVAAGPSRPRASALESQALTMLLLSPTLTAELDPAEPLSMRDGSAQALVDAWRAAVAAESTPDLERFVSGLDVASAELARSLLASARVRGMRPDTATDGEELRILLLRLRKEQVQERLADLQALISAGSRDPDQTDINELERQFQVLHLEREQLEQAINPSAVMAGQRRR